MVCVHLIATSNCLPLDLVALLLLLVTLAVVVFIARLKPDPLALNYTLAV